MQIEPDFQLANHNTLALKAQARAFARVESQADIREALAWARAEGCSTVPLGQGSNVVFNASVDSLVMQLANRGREIRDREGERVRLRVQAGENWHEFVRWSLQQGCYGLANLALIPGTVGAAPIQNIGAYGVELDQFIEAVHGIWLDSGEPLSLPAGECGFAYRDSVFKQALRDKVVVTAVDFCLPLQDEAVTHYPSLAAHLDAQGIASPNSRDVFDAVVAIRRERLPDPAQEPNAGSFFKNPVISASQASRLQQAHPGLPRYPAGAEQVKVPAAWLIEHSGWKGEQREGVGVHPGHALVLVNYGANSGQKLLQLASEIQASVREGFGIELEMEPRTYGAAL